MQCAGEPRRSKPGEAIQYLRLHEPFRRDVVQAQSTVAKLAVCLGSIRPRRRRIERAGRHTVEAQRGYLITHQGNEWRHHHGQAFGRQSRKLVAHRLARSGWHHRQDILACQQCRDDILLPGPEPVVAEGALQNREGNVESWQLHCFDWHRLAKAWERMVNRQSRQGVCPWSEMAYTTGTVGAQRLPRSRNAASVYVLRLPRRRPSG